MAIVKRVLCLDLPTAGLVIGFVEILWGLWEVVETLLCIVYPEEYIARIDKEVHTNDSTILTFLYVIFVISLFDLLSAIMLILGIKRKSHRMLLPWLAIKGLALIILIPISGLCLLIGFYCAFNDQGTLIFIRSIFLLILVVVYCYMFLAVYSLYNLIRDETRKPNEVDPNVLYPNFNSSTTVRYNKT